MRLTAVALCRSNPRPKGRHKKPKPEAGTVQGISRAQTPVFGEFSSGLPDFAAEPEVQVPG